MIEEMKSESSESFADLFVKLKESPVDKHKLPRSAQIRSSLWKKEFFRAPLTSVMSFLMLYPLQPHPESSGKRTPFRLA